MTNNQTNSKRAARRLQTEAAVTYQQAWNALRTHGSYEAALAALQHEPCADETSAGATSPASHLPTTSSAWYAETGTGDRLCSTTADRDAAVEVARAHAQRLIRVTYEDGLVVDDWLEHDFQASPHWMCDECECPIYGNSSVSSDHTDSCSLHPDNVHEHHDVVYPDDDGDFVLSDSSFGNPGCDVCGSADAVVKLDGVYMCDAEAAERGVVLMVEFDPAEPQRATMWCRFCHRDAGADYHFAGVIDPGENNVVCDECWDPRLA